jgi:hypothetical protein
MKRGQGFMGWLVIIFGLILLPYLLIGWRAEFKYVIMAVIGLGIYNFLRNFFGDGILTIGLAAVFFYYLVWKHFWTFSILWWVYALLGMGILSSLGWGYITFSSVFRGRRR